MTKLSLFCKAALVFILVAALASCAPPAKKDEAVEAPPLPPPSPAPPVESQERLAMVAYEEILEMTANARRVDILQDLETAYIKLIADYPDTYIAQESYWRLIRINMLDYKPPRVAKAEEHYEKFKEAYPDSRFRIILDDTIVRFYYQHEMWEKLEGATAKYIREYISTGELSTPMFMFLYSEAKLNLDDIVEAKKGFKIVIKHHPGSTEARLSRERLKKIEDKEGDS